jgi:hypothetical protein
MTPWVRLPKGYTFRLATASIPCPVILRRGYHLESTLRMLRALSPVPLGPRITSSPVESTWSQWSSTCHKQEEMNASDLCRTWHTHSTQDNTNEPTQSSTYGINSQTSRTFREFINKTLYTWLPRPCAGELLGFSLAHLSSSPPPNLTPNGFTDSHDLSSQVSLFPFIFGTDRPSEWTTTRPPAHVQISPAIANRPSPHIHPSLAFSLRVNLLFSLVYRGSSQCHIAMLTNRTRLFPRLV